MNPSNIKPNTIKQFTDLYLKCNRASPTSRIQYQIDSASPVLNSATTKSLFAEAALRSQNAYTLHVLEYAIIKAGFPEENARAALLYLSKLSISSSSLTVGDLGSILTLLSTNDPNVLGSYLILQGMADIISTDYRFVEVLCQEVKNSGKFSATAAKGMVARQKRTIHSGGESAGNLTAGATSGQYAMGVMNLMIVPAGIVNKCIDICNRTDEAIALTATNKLAKALSNPLAQRMADVLGASASNEAFAAATGATLSLVGTGLTAGLAPGGLNPVAMVGNTLGVPSSPGSGLIASAVASNAFKFGKPALTTVTKLVLKEWAVGEALSQCKSGFIAPLFTIRKSDRSERDFKDLRFLPPQETKTYNLFDKKLVISLLAYLAVPLEPLPEKDYKQYNARAMLKNLLGSYIEENAVRPISIGMRPQDYLTNIMGYFNANGLDGIDQSQEDLEYKFKKQRPPSFLRLLCVGAGLLSDDRPDIAKEKGSWKPIYVGDLKKLGKEIVHNGGVWKDPDEIFFSKFKSEEETTEGMAKSYLCRPWLADKALHEKIKDNQLIKKSSLLLNHPTYEHLKESVEVKSRWERDKENPKCSFPECGAKAGKIKTGLSHCRSCGKIYCSEHLIKGQFISEMGITMANMDWPGMVLISLDGKVCDECWKVREPYFDRLRKEPGVFYNLLALKEGDAVVRPMFMQNKDMSDFIHEIDAAGGRRLSKGDSEAGRMSTTIERLSKGDSEAGRGSTIIERLSSRDSEGDS